MKKSILFVYDKNMAGLPPFLTLLDSLVGKYSITVIAAEYNDEIDKIYEPKGVKFIHYYKEEPRRGIASRIRNRLRRDYILKLKAPKDIRRIKHDILWIISESCGIKIKKELLGRDYIFSIYELRDRAPKILKGIKRIAQKAKVNVVPEYNRAHMLRLWLKLENTPIVLPNKPLLHPRKKKQDCTQAALLQDKKLVLYQGHISRDRNLEALCKAVSSLKDYTLLLMGDGGEYIEYLKEKYPKVIFLDFIRPPLHLNVTSYARIAVVTYDYYSLNTLFCAPNKIWEYSGFGIPMLANSIPGLVYTVGKYKAGLCIDMDNPEEIKNAIVDIEKNYVDYENHANVLFESCNVKEIINRVISDYYGH
ncbi:MAG: glycosyltransferase [Marinifilaceae bacterium]